MINDGCNHYGDIDIGSNSDRQGADQEFRKRAAGAGWVSLRYYTTTHSLPCLHLVFFLFVKFWVRKREEGPELNIIPLVS